MHVKLMEISYNEINILAITHYLLLLYTTDRIANGPGARTDVRFSLSKQMQTRIV